MSIVTSKIQDLRKINLQSLKITSRINYLYELMESEGLRCHILNDTPKQKLLPKSFVETQAIDKVSAKKEIEDLEDKYRLLTLEMDVIFKDIQYLIRSSEFELLQDVYHNQYSTKKLQKIHGQNFEYKLNRILKKYGVQI